MGEQRTTDPRQHTRDHERSQLGAHRGDRVALRGAFVLAHRDDHPTGPRPPDASRGQVAQRQHEQGVHVVAGRRVETDLPEQRRPLEPRVPLREPSEEAIAEQPLLGGQRHRERGHSQVQPSQAQGRHTDSEGDHSAGATADQQADCQVDVPSRRAGRADRGTDTDDGHLTERDLPRPPGQHHERQPDDRKREDRRGLDDVVDVQHHRRPDHHDQPDDAEGPPSQAHVRVPPIGECKRAHFLRTPPRAGGIVVAAVAAGALHEQHDEHDRRHDRVGRSRRVGVEPHAGLQQAQRDRGHGNRRQPFEPGDDEGSERLQQRRQPSCIANRHADDPTAQEQGDERHCRGDRPHQRVQPAHRNAEHCRPITSLGAGPNRHAVAAAGEEPGDADHHQRCHDQGDEVVGVEDDLTEGQLPPDRWGDAFTRQVAAPPPRDQDADHDQQLGDAQRGHGDHQPGRVSEPADQGELDDHTSDDRQHQPGGQPEQVRPAPEDDERGSERGRHGTELGLREVDHPIGSVDQRHADRHDCVEAAERQPVQPQPQRQPEEDQLDTDDRGDGRERDDASGVDVADTGPSHATTVVADLDRWRRLARHGDPQTPKV